MRAFVFALVMSLSVLPQLALAQPKLQLQIGERDIDVERRTIHFVLATAAASAEIEVYSPEGQLLHAGQQEYAAASPGERLEIGWPDLGDDADNFRIELKFTDTSGNWVTFQVIRFYVEIPHEDVEFASGKWDISAEQRPKLEQPLGQLKEAAANYAELMDVSVYVAGHTDTVGKASDNQRLSEKRAESIARFFVKQGLRGIPILVRGFGEGALLVQTGDNVDEQKNRRAQYIISSFVPPIAGPGGWRRVQ